MRNIFISVLVFLIIFNAESSENYKVILNYNFFSKIKANHEYDILNRMTFSYKQDYMFNFVSGSVGIGKNINNRIMLDVEGILNSDYVSNSALPIIPNFVSTLDYSKIFLMGIATNIYYSLHTKNDLNYYIAVGTGITRLYGIKDKFQIFPYLLQAKFGIKYEKITLFKPYMAYKYIYMKEFKNKEHKVNFTSHNLECGLEISI